MGVIGLVGIVGIFQLNEHAAHVRRTFSFCRLILIALSVAYAHQPRGGQKILAWLTHDP